MGKTLSLCLASLVTAFIWSATAAADILETIDGRRYENVYVHESGSLYHVRFPSDGSTLHVFKSDVPEGGVILSNKKDRKILGDLWWSKQDQLDRTGQTETRAAREAAAAPLVPPRLKRDEPEPQLEVNLSVRKHGIAAVKGSDGAVHLTNRPRKLAAKSRGRTVYVGKSGVGVLTNLHSKFQDDDQYTAINIPFERIEVPARFYRMGTESFFTSTELSELVDHYAARYRLDPALVFAVIEAESAFNPNAVSHAGARGLMQLMPGTAAEMGVTDPFDPAQNIAGGTQYLRLMFDMFHSETLALAAYNAGPGRVKRIMRIPVNGETERYVPKVQRFKKKYARGFTPDIRVAAGPRQGLDYLPPDGAEHVRIVLINGTVTAAEEVTETPNYYSWEFGHQSGTVQKYLVKEVIYPERGSTAD